MRFKNFLTIIKKISAGILMFLFLGASCYAQQSHAPLPVDSFAARIGREAAPQIIDVRTPEEFAVNHIHGAIEIDLRKEGYLNGLSTFDKERPVFIYAIQNKRSGILAELLRKEGFREVYELRSGIASWIGAGYPYYTSVKDRVTPADYRRSVSGKGPVLVDIGTSYCGLCRQVRGMVDSLRIENPSYRVVEIDLYGNPQLVATLKEVKAVPTLLLYKDGQVVWKRTGLTFTRADIEDEVAKIK